MKRFVRRAIYCLVPAVLAAVVLGVPTAAPDIGLQNVELTCNDGTGVSLSLDPLAVLQLSDAVGAINLYPAGEPALACSLTQSVTLTNSSAQTLSSALGTTQLLDPAGGNPQHDYVVGGGQQAVGTCPPYNFSVEAHVVEGAPADTASGHLNFTIPAGNVCFPSTPDQVSQFRVSIDCLKVSTPSTADMQGVIEKATGYWGNPAFTPGTRVWIGATDNPDAIDATIANGGPKTALSCGVGPAYPISKGNITVHQATP
jgi:hypothetical protein